MKRLSISIPDICDDWVRTRAKARNTTVSDIIKKAIQNEMRTSLQKLIISGLEEDAELHRAMANDDWKRVAEIEAMNN